MKEAEIRPQDLFNEYLALARRDAQKMLAGAASFVGVPCPGCGESGGREAFEKLGFHYALCEACGSIYNSPRPTSETIDKFYREGESVAFWSQRFFRETADVRREKMFRPRAELIARISDERGSGTGIFVDVGSGYGICLEEVAKLGRFKRVVGIEPGPELAAYCRDRGFEIAEKPVEAVATGELEADFATSFEVLEHVFQPEEFLRGVRRVLKPGGLLLLTTLTVDGFDIQVLWDKSNSIHPPHHINLLSLSGIEKLLQRSGFKALDVSTPGKLDFDIVGNAERENPDLQLPRFVRSLLQRSDGVKADFQDCLARNRMSSHARIIAQAV